MGDWELHGLWGGRHGGLVRLAVPGKADLLVPRRAVVLYTDPVEPTYRVYLEVQDGRAVVTGVHVVMAQGGRGVRPRDLHDLELDLRQLAKDAFERLQVRAEQSEDEPDAQLLFAGTARRGSPSRAELERVAAIYQQHIKSAPNKAVRLLMGYGSERTTTRRVRQAQEAGLLPSTHMGKRRSGGPDGQHQ